VVCGTVGHAMLLIVLSPSCHAKQTHLSSRAHIDLIGSSQNQDYTSCCQTVFSLVGVTGWGRNYATYRSLLIYVTSIGYIIIL
jgi:hypothetical protein